MNRRSEEKAAMARKAAEAHFKRQKALAAAVKSEKELEREACSAKIERLRALRLAKEAAPKSTRR